MTRFNEHWSVSPEDHTRGRGGFNGEWFDSPGITDHKFETLESACAAIEKRFARWERIHAPNNSSDAIYKAPGKPKFLVVNHCIGAPIRDDET
jgi:hypothetical protein